MPIYIDPEGNEHSIQQVRTTYSVAGNRLVIDVLRGINITNWQLVVPEGDYKGVKAKKAKGDGKGIR
jgi:hypothetical protein